MPASRAWFRRYEDSSKAALSVDDPVIQTVRRSIFAGHY